MPQTILAFDFGTHRIGVSVGQTATCTAQALPEIKAIDGIPNLEQLNKTIKEWQPNILVVGLPLNMDDSDNEITTRARKFASRLHERYKLPVELMDERLSTVAAKAELLEQGESINLANKPVDSIAARLILESWFNARRTADDKR